MRDLVEVIHSHGAIAALQIAHAGPKANTNRPWEGYRPLGPAQAALGEYSWESVAPTAEPTDEGWRVPRALTGDDFPVILDAYRRATRRAEAAGFDVLEVHGAHGYLLPCFLSPLANHRNDAYGGDLAGRMRFPLEVAEAVRAEWPEEKPLFYRTSAVDGVDGGLTMDDTVVLAEQLKTRGVDVLDCSSTGIRGATAVSGGVPKVEGYQVPYAARMCAEVGLATMTVGSSAGPSTPRKSSRTAPPIWSRSAGNCCATRSGRSTRPKPWGSTPRWRYGPSSMAGGSSGASTPKDSKARTCGPRRAPHGRNWFGQSRSKRRRDRGRN